MKFQNNSSALLSFLFAFTICAWLYKESPKATHDKKELENKELHHSARDGGDDAEWQHYEVMRMADPATGRIPDGIRMKELAFAATLPKNTDARLRGASGYVNRGPWNVGGRTRAFAMDVANHSILIAGSTSGDIYRSTDDGATWTSVTPASALKGITCISQDTRPGHTDTWYAGTGEAFGQSASTNGSYYFGNGVLKSTDDGLTWNALANTTTTNNYGLYNFFELVWNVVTDPSDTVNDVVYAATYGDIYRSQDGGTTWTAVLASNGTDNSYFTDIAVTSTGVVYATMSDDGNNKGIWRSPDGISFTNIMPVDKVAPTDTFPDYNRIVIGVSPMDENTVYFFANTPGTGTADTNFLGDVQWNSLWRYHYIKGNGADTGGTWQDLSSHIPHKGTSFDMCDVQGSYNMVLAVKPDDSNTVFLGCTNIFRSTTGFTDDNHITKIGGYALHAHLPVVAEWANHHPDNHVLFFDPDNANILYNGSDGGVFKTTNCMADTVQWQTFDHGYITSMFYTVAVDHATPNDPVIVGGLQDNGSWFTNSTDPTQNWAMPGGADGGSCAIASGKTAYYISQDMGKTFRMILDANGNVTSFARIDPIVDTPANYLFVTPFVLDPNDESKLYFASGNRLWRNNDLNTIPMVNNYDSISTNWVSFTDTVSGGQISAIACSNPPAHTLYYGTTNGQVYKVVNANTGSPTAQNITGSTFPRGSGFVSCIAVDPNNADNLIAVFSNYNIYPLFYSNNGGTSWTRIEGNMQSDGGSGGPSLRWATFAHLADGNTAYFLATSIGLFATDTLNGTKTTWVQQSADVIGNEVCNMIDYRASDGLIAVATHSKGIFTANISSINDIATVKDIPAPSASLTNYPNPFNGETTISFTLQKPAYVTLTVYDLFGREISRLSNNTWTSEGEHSFPFSDKQFPSGMYLCRLQASGIDKTIGMMSGR